jgi:hypothetical protein
LGGADCCELWWNVLWHFELHMYLTASGLEQKQFLALLITDIGVGVRPELLTNVGYLIRRPEDKGMLRMMFSMWGSLLDTRLTHSQ